MLIPVIYIVAMIPENFIELLIDIPPYHNVLSLITVVVIPIIILIGALIRKKVLNK